MQQASVATPFDLTTLGRGVPKAAVTSARQRMRALDACLDQLEEASASGSRTVSRELAARVAPWIELDHGMAITAALDRVFQCQREFMSGMRTEGAAPSCLSGRRDNQKQVAARVATPRPALTADEARSITTEIKGASGGASRLLLEAHDGRAWRALGYSSWHRYVHDEFGLSRSRSYELIDQARVIEALEAAAGMSRIPDMPVYAAAQLKPRLQAIVADIESRKSELGAGVALEVLMAGIIDDARAFARADHRQRRPDRRSTNGRPIAEMLMAILCTSRSLPSPQEFVESHGGVGSVDPGDALQCAAWFEALAQHLAARDLPRIVYSASSTS